MTTWSHRSPCHATSRRSGGSRPRMPQPGASVSAKRCSTTSRTGSSSRASTTPGAICSCGLPRLAPMPTLQYRAHFDFDIRFANGGALAGTGFRLDLPSDSLSSDDIARLLVKHLGLTLVDEVELRGLRILDEPH